MSAPQETIHIRAAGLEDASALATLNATVQSLHARLVPELFKPAGAETYDHHAMQRIVAQEDTIVVYLHHISVEDSFRRMGVGSALLHAIGAAGIALGIERLATEAWCENRPAIAFFQAHGLVPYTQKLARGGWGVALPVP